MITLTTPVATRHDGYYLTGIGEAIACQLDTNEGEFLRLTTIEPATIGSYRAQEPVQVLSHAFAPIEYTRNQANLIAQDLASDAYTNYLKARGVYVAACSSGSITALDKSTNALELSRSALHAQCSGYVYRIRWCEDAAAQTIDS